MEEIKKDVMTKVAETNGLILPQPEAEKDSVFSSEIDDESLLDEGAIPLDLDISAD